MTSLFGTDGIRGTVGRYPMTPEAVLHIGWALGQVLPDGPVLIGKDTRASGYMFAAALEAGLTAAGVDCIQLGPVPTPAVAYLVPHVGAAAGVVISASHNPYSDNGLKFFSAQGTKLDATQEQQIASRLEQTIVTAADRLGCARRMDDAAQHYVSYCQQAVPLSLHGLKLVIDAAHGATYAIAPRLFAELGAEVVAIGVAPDGLNINLDSGATAPMTLAAKVVDARADCGIALDGDGDRLIMVDASGNIVDGDQILYLLARDSLQQQTLKGGVVGTVMSNLGLEHSLNDLGIAFCRAPVGDRFVLEAMQARDWCLGGETSGHIISLDVASTGDGLLTALKVLAVMRRAQASLAELVEPMQLYPQHMINVNVIERYDPMQVPTTRMMIQRAQTALGARGRILVRASGTEPVIRVMVEGQHRAEIISVAEGLAAAIAQQH